MRYAAKFGFCGLLLLASLSSKEASAQFLNSTVTGAGSGDAASWVAGAVAGYNWQQGSLVFGIETDFQGTHLKTSVNPTLLYVPPIPGPGDYATASSSIDWYGTLRGRFGTTVGQLPLLVYVTGGVAYGNVSLNSAFSAFGLTTTAQTEEPRIGGVVGAGAEYIVSPNSMITFQYQYVDFGRLNVASSTSSGFATISQSASTHANFQTAMIGWSFRFAPDGSRSPWAGGYAGVHAGGAWGNTTNAAYSGISQVNN